MTPKATAALLATWLTLPASAPAVEAPAAATAVPAVPAVSAVSADDAARLGAERSAEHREFRQHFDAGNYSAALPHAEKVVALTEALDPAHPELARALSNLGATHYQLGDFLAAALAYERALKLVEARRGSTSRELVWPLVGLGRAYQGNGRHDAAVPLLERAVAISRRAEGLFNAGQQQALDPLIDGYLALGRNADADREQQYSLRVAEHEFGAKDVRMIPALQRLAHWYENTRRHTHARVIWQRMLTISATKGQQSFVGLITGLRGIAHTYVLDYNFGPEFIEQDTQRPGEIGMHGEFSERDAFGRPLGSIPGGEYRLDSQGREALEQALKIAQAVKPPSEQALLYVLLDLGDWHMLADRLEQALPFYQRALPYVPAESGTPEARGNPLSAPRQLLYRPPVSAQRLKAEPAEGVIEKVAVAEFTVTAEGRARDIRIVEGDANDTQRSAFSAALSKTLFRPRFVEGKPVATENIRQRETFRQSKR